MEPVFRCTLEYQVEAMQHPLVVSSMNCKKIHNQEKKRIQYGSSGYGSSSYNGTFVMYDSRIQGFLMTITSPNNQTLHSCRVTSSMIQESLEAGSYMLHHGVIRTIDDITGKKMELLLRHVHRLEEPYTLEPTMIELSRVWVLE